MHICLVNVPRYEIHRPPLSLATLAAMCQDQGVDHSCLDFSLVIWQKLPDDFHAIDDFCITRHIRADVRERLQALIDQHVCDTVQRRPDTVFAISLLSVWSRPVTEMFCASIRSHSQCRILLGGQGLTGAEWTDRLRSQGLVDDFIVGEAEITFPQYLKGVRTAPGINNYDFEQIDDLDAHCVIPDYRGLPLDQYPYITDRPDLFITASRGCVRNCGYCDIGHQWKKYRYRSARHVATEMITQYERHGIRDFFFTDSLINGSMKMLNELCDLLIQYREQHPEVDFRWRGQYIFRARATVREEHIQRMVAAGVDFLIIGLETGSDRVRHDMNKKHSTDDAEWYLEMFKKYGIQCRLLMITGWVTETQEDHAQTLALFRRWQRFVASNTITGIELGSILMVLEHSPLAQRQQELDMHFHNHNPWAWHCGANPELDYFERVRRRIETHREAMKYKWPITRSLYRLETIRRNLIDVIEHLEQQPPTRPQRHFPIRSQ